MDLELIISILLAILCIILVIFCIIRVGVAGFKILYVCIRKNKVYNRWVKIQRIREDKIKFKQDEKLKAEIEKAVKQNSIKKFALRRHPKLLNFYKKLRIFNKYVCKVFNVTIKIVFIILGVLIALLLLYWVWEWITSNPLAVIIFLLILILLKK